MMTTVIKVLFIFLIFICKVEANDYQSVSKLKTFFTTSSERAKLDQKRQTGNYSGKPAVSGVSVMVEPKKVKLRGLVMREKGDPVVWVNDGNTLKSKQIDNDIRVNTQNIKSNKNVPLKVNNRHISMKPGEEWNESANQIKDSYQSKQVVSQSGK